MATCMEQCYQDILLRHCKCVEPEMFYFANKATTKPCNMSNTAQGRCVRQYESAFRRGNVSKHCKDSCSQACTEVDYEVQISSARWPNSYYLDILKESAVVRNDKMRSFIEHETDDESHDIGDNDKKLKENLLKVDVYYQTLNYKAIVEQPAYLVFDMLADLGGAVDLWVGMSVLAMCQCIEFLLELLHYICCRSNVTSKKKVSVVDQNSSISKSTKGQKGQQRRSLQRQPLPRYESSAWNYNSVGHPYYSEESMKLPNIT